MWLDLPVFVLAGNAVPEATIDRGLRNFKGRQRQATLVGGGDLTLHHLGEEATSAVGGQDSHAAYAGCLYTPAGNGHVERIAFRESDGIGAVEGRHAMPDLGPLSRERQPRLVEVAAKGPILHLHRGR